MGVHRGSVRGALLALDVGAVHIMRVPPGRTAAQVMVSNQTTIGRLEGRRYSQRLLLAIAPAQRELVELVEILRDE